MLDTRHTARLLLIAAVTVATMSSCGSSTSWLDRVWPSDSDDVAEPLSPGSPNADDYLRDLDLLTTGDVPTQVEIYSDAESAATLTPGPSTNLRYALVLATPGHSGTDFDQAHGLLRELLAQTALMTPSEVALAHIYLNSVEQQLMLQSEARRLRESTTERGDRTEEQAIAQRLAAVEAENRRLRTELADAEDKLEAITTIERSIREQGQ